MAVTEKFSVLGFFSKAANRHGQLGFVFFQTPQHVTRIDHRLVWLIDPLEARHEFLDSLETDVTLIPADIARAKIEHGLHPSNCSFNARFPGGAPCMVDGQFNSFASERLIDLRPGSQTFHGLRSVDTFFESEAAIR